MALFFLLSPAKTLDFQAKTLPAPLKLDKKETSSSAKKSSKVLSCRRRPASNALHPFTKALIKKISGLSKGALGKLLSVSASLAALNHARYNAFDISPSGLLDEEGEMREKPAILAYKGAAYLGLDASSLSVPQLHYLDKHLGVISGLYGIVKPLDVIQPYRLDMGTKVEVGIHKNLYKFWGSVISSEVTAMVEALPVVGKGERVIVNVASQEYFKAVLPTIEAEGKIKVVTCEFKDGGRVLSVYAKRARGMLVRYAVENECKTIDDLKRFNMENYRLDKRQSTEDRLVFARAKPPPKAKKDKGKAKAKGKRAIKEEVASSRPTKVKRRKK